MNARKWVPVLVALSAVSLLAYGAFAFLGKMRSQTASLPDGGAQPPMVGGKKRPKDFGLPEFPTAHAFVSAEDGTPDRGSSAFTVRKGTAKEIAAFYRKELPDKGWTFVEERGAAQQPGKGAIPNPPTVTGLRQRWTNGTRSLNVLALDFIQLKSTAQVVISWSPAAESPPAKP